MSEVKLWMSSEETRQPAQSSWQLVRALATRFVDPLKDMRSRRAGSESVYLRHSKASPSSRFSGSKLG